MASGLRLVYRRDRQLHVPQRLDQHATEPSQRPSAPNSGSRTPPTTSSMPSCWCCTSTAAPSASAEQISGGRRDHVRRRHEAQPHPARVALVRQLRMIDLDHGRVAEPFGRRRRRLRHCSTAPSRSPESRHRPAGPARLPSGQQPVPAWVRRRAGRPRAAAVRVARTRRAAGLPAPGCRGRHPGSLTRSPHRTATPTACAVRSGQAKTRYARLLQQVRVRVRGTRRHPADVDRHRHPVRPQPRHRVPDRRRHLRPTRTAAAAPAPPRRSRRTGPAFRSRAGYTVVNRLQAGRHVHRVPRAGVAGQQRPQSVLQRPAQLRDLQALVGQQVGQLHSGAAGVGHHRDPRARAAPAGRTAPGPRPGPAGRCAPGPRRPGAARRRGPRRRWPARRCATPRPAARRWSGRPRTAMTGLTGVVRQASVKNPRASVIDSSSRQMTVVSGSSRR